MTKRKYQASGIAVLAFVFIASAKAALVPTLGGQAYYDTVLDVTWLTNANLAASNTFGVAGIDPAGFMTWDTANDWIAAMNSAEHLGTSGWRMPKNLPVNGVAYDNTPSLDGTTDNGFNITSPNSELAYMFYVNLGNSGFFDPVGNINDPFGLLNSGNFQNLQEDVYWSGSQFAGDAWAFDNFFGDQFTFAKNNEGFVWAVHDGFVVPVPAAVWLFGSGALCLAGIARRKR